MGGGDIRVGDTRLETQKCQVHEVGLQGRVSCSLWLRSDFKLCSPWTFGLGHFDLSPHSQYGVNCPSFHMCRKKVYSQMKYNLLSHLGC